MRKLKSIWVMVIILSLLLFATIIGIVVTGRNKNKVESILEEEVNVIPETFVGTINNNVNVPSEIVDLIINYNDALYLSIYTLEQLDTADYFTNEIAAAISNCSIKLMVESRKLYDFDFTLTDACYDINFSQCIVDSDTYYVDFLMDESMDFAFLNGISSESFDIENYLVIKNVDGQYKIDDYEKVQGYYKMFYENEYASKEDVEDIYEYYFDRLSSTIENENYLKQKALENNYLADKAYDVAYDRDKAVAYADKYYHLRNDEWYDFSEEGGNCQNYASQCLNAGGITMDYSGDQEWKCYMEDGDYDPGVNEDNEAAGRSTSWVQVYYFSDYCKYNEGSGLVSDANANINYAEAGDIIQVGITSISHTTIVSKVVDGHILLNSNSIDMKNWPLEAYTYPTRKLIKILGYNK